MQPSDYFTEISTKSEIVDLIWQQVQEQEGWVEHYSFRAKQINRDVWVKDTFLKQLSEKYNLLVGILSMSPNTVYNWHIDSGAPHRKLGINMLLSESPSHCLFTDDKDQVLSNSIELHYAPNTYYVFNTKKQHMVVNLGKPRFLLSVTLLGKNESSDMSYNEMVSANYSEDDAISYDEFIKELEEYANA